VKGLVPVDNDRRGRPREHPATSSSSPNFQGKPYVWWRHFRWKGPTRADIAQLPVAHACTLPRESLRGHVRSLRVTFHNVTSGEKAPLVRILRNLRLRMCAPFQGNNLRSHVRSLRVTFHNVISGQKAPLGRILRMRTLKGTPQRNPLRGHVTFGHFR